MKTKVKSILFSLLAVMAVAVFLTSCQQQSIVIEELEGLNAEVHDSNGTTEEVVEPPLTLEELDAIWQEMEQSEGDNVELRNNCGCSRLHQSTRNSTSRYIYCHNWSINNKYNTVNYITTGTNGTAYYNDEYQSDYYHEVYNLQPNKTYRFFACYGCTDNSHYYSNWIHWRQ